MKNAQIDLSNYNAPDLNAIRQQAAEMRAVEMKRIAASVKSWIKSHFTFGVVTHA